MEWRSKPTGKVGQPPHATLMHGKKLVIHHKVLVQSERMNVNLLVAAHLCVSCQVPAGARAPCGVGVRGPVRWVDDPQLSRPSHDQSDVVSGAAIELLNAVAQYGPVRTDEVVTDTLRPRRDDRQV